MKPLSMMFFSLLLREVGKSISYVSVAGAFISDSESDFSLRQAKRHLF
jgi:hypothetical protein